MTTHDVVVTIKRASFGICIVMIYSEVIVLSVFVAHLQHCRVES